MPRNPVLESAEFISNHSQDVSVPREGIQAASRLILEAMKQQRYSTHSWKQNDLHPKDASIDALQWVFLVDTLNFSFYHTPPEKPFTVTYRGKAYTGYWSLCACINRALDEGIPIHTPEFCRDISLEQFRHVFRGDPEGGSVALLEERWRAVQETGRVIVEKYQGRVENVVRAANHSALEFLKIVTRDFSSFQDEREFCGRRVQIYKRAQILIADIWACFDGQSFGRFDDIDEITMFADYRVPQALLHYGCLQYSPALLEILGRNEELDAGCRLEIEIRGNSIWSVELVRREIKAMLEADPDNGQGLRVNAILIDFYVWDYSKREEDKMKHLPIHRTRSIYY
ncbi:UPF0553 protein C9orf64-like protein [Polychytrium aggregatum]|uniref:UPF0553 protein C9orf64-like protein n=1 Tax=Polychytrium aggregatum TaxID=110093 RepID=UPI0022FF4315|nr:UPF0553 protein C9orf64-like protein [Polychytrium aggregatum]KAI9206437.1 UPF0553 protein C9orf64-like protein [Polychytrium aggregatum]